MKTVQFVGLDVQSEKIAVAVAEPDGEVRFLGVIQNREDSVCRMVRKLGDPKRVLRSGPDGIRAVLATDRYGR